MNYPGILVNCKTYNITNMATYVRTTGITRLTTVSLNYSLTDYNNPVCNFYSLISNYVTQYNE